MNKIREYWINSKKRFKFLVTVSNIVEFLFFTDKTWWHERSLSGVSSEFGNLPQTKAKIPIEFSFSSTKETIDCIKSFDGEWMNHPKEIEIGLKENHIYSNAKYNGRIVAIYKTAVNEAYIADYDKVISLPPDMALIYHAYIYPEFRRENISPAVLVGIMCELENKGFKKIGAYNSDWNTATPYVLNNYRYKKIAYIRQFRIFRIINFWIIRDLKTGKKRITNNISKHFQLFS